MAEKQLYPRPERPKPDHSDRPWAVAFALAYDGGGVGEWTQYYHTKFGARFSAWWNYHVGSWGGTAVLIDNRKPRYRNREFPSRNPNR